MHWKPKSDLYPPYLRSRIRRGRGVGQGTSYRPWLRVREVPSRGTGSVVYGISVRRPHHLLSELEATYFFLLERRSRTVDIREQWPILDIDSTLRLCANQGVRHAYRGPYPEPFTIDFVIKERDEDGNTIHRAASIKTPEDAKDPQIQQRLAVEHAWCQEHDVAWTLVDTSAFDKTLLSNLRFLRSWFRHRHKPAPDRAARFADLFLSDYREDTALSELVERTRKRLRISDALALDLFRYCGWTNLIPVALTTQISLNRALALSIGPRHARI